MNITYFNYLYDLYGASIGSTIKAVELFRSLESLGHRVHMHWRKGEETDTGVTAQKKLRLFFKRHLDRVLHEPNQLLQNIRYYREESAILRAENPDLMIARLETNVFSPVFLAKNYRLPFIAEVDSPVTYEIRHFTKGYLLPYKLLEKLEMDFILRADAAFCVSEQLKAHFVRRGVPGDHLHVIPNGADVSRFHPDVPCADLREVHGLEGKTVIGFIGSFHYWHGVDQLMKLMDTVLGAHRDAVFLMAGKGGPMRRQLQEHISARHGDGRVHLLSHVSHERIPALINAMDIVLAPYPALPFFYYSPVKIYEYMACGKPVVTSRSGQIAEIVQDMHNGMLCEPGQTGEFAERIALLINKPSLRKSMGKKAWECVQNKHTWAHRARQLQALCEYTLTLKRR
ncbi:glycosyltransferase family 4 protein [bacterium]|nr:glycosyltransferase family 4 protein [bacterium]